MGRWQRTRRVRRSGAEKDKRGSSRENDNAIGGERNDTAERERLSRSSKWNKKEK